MMLEVGNGTPRIICASVPNGLASGAAGAGGGAGGGDWVQEMSRTEMATSPKTRFIYVLQRNRGRPARAPSADSAHIISAICTASTWKFPWTAKPSMSRGGGGGPLCTVGGRVYLTGFQGVKVS